jgi:GT2 family glycosyltransferase
LSGQGPLVSVVIPTYNRAYCLARTVDSALGQSYGNLEVLLVDDGSTDGTKGFVAERYGSDPRVRYIGQKNAGVSAARNTGMANARGALIALLDSDDIWLPWKLQLQVACMQAHPELVMTWTDMDAIDGSSQITPAYLRRMYAAYRWFPTSEDLFTGSAPLATLCPALATTVGTRKFHFGDIFSKMVLGNLVHTSTVVLTREAAGRVKGFREDFRGAGEDYDYHLRTCREGPVGYLDVSSIQYERGLTDHIANPSNGIHFARNFLRSVQPIIDQERHRLTLSDQQIRGVLAKAHAWIGRELFEQGERAGAARELALSLRYQPWQPRILMMLAAAPLPPPLRTKVRHGVRALKRAVGVRMG